MQSDYQNSGGKMKQLVITGLFCLLSSIAAADSIVHIRAAGAADATFGIYLETRVKEPSDEENPVAQTARLIVVTQENGRNTTQEFSCENTRYQNSATGRQMEPGVFVLNCGPREVVLFWYLNAPEIKSPSLPRSKVDWSQTCGSSSLLFTKPVAVAANFGHHEICLEDWSKVKNPKARLESGMRKMAKPSPTRLRLEADRQRYEKALEDERERASAADWKKRRDEYAKTLQSDIFYDKYASFEQHINAGADINLAIGFTDNLGKRAPLLVALDKPESARYALALIARGANIAPEGLYKGVNVLMLAAGNSTPEVMHALLARQAFDVNQRNPNGATALSYAVLAGRIENVRLLLSLGADVRVNSPEGSLIDLARLQGFAEIEKLLMQGQH